MKVVVSACLLGHNCKYSGGNNFHPGVAAFLEHREVIAVCPEVLAGMGVPRTPVEIVSGVLMDRTGRNVDAQLRDAVRVLLDRLRGEAVDCAILQSRSPTCGVNQVYDGSFSGKLTEGSGVFAQALLDAGYTVIDAAEFGGK